LKVEKKDRKVALKQKMKEEQQARQAAAAERELVPA